MRLFTIDELATTFAVDAKTVRRWVWTGKLKHFKLGKVVRVREEWVEEFIAAHLRT